MSSLDGGGTVTSEEILYYSDYSNGLSTTVDVTTLFTFSGFAANASDTLTSLGGSNSTPATSGDGASFSPLNPGPPVTIAGFINAYTLPTDVVTINYTNTCVSGCAVAQTGIAQLVFSYTPAVVGSPEPGSMMLLGSGLLAAGLLGRKKLVRK
jgi:hypothetical protein